MNGMHEGEACARNWFKQAFFDGVIRGSVAACIGAVMFLLRPLFAIFGISETLYMAIVLILGTGGTWFMFRVIERSHRSSI
jgi:hypothetical protein